MTLSCITAVGRQPRPPPPLDKTLPSSLPPRFCCIGQNPAGFFGKLALARTPYPNRPTYGSKERGYDLGGLVRGVGLSVNTTAKRREDKVMTLIYSDLGRTRLSSRNRRSRLC